MRTWDEQHAEIEELLANDELSDEMRQQLLDIVHEHTPPTVASIAGVTMRKNIDGQWLAVGSAGRG